MSSTNPIRQPTLLRVGKNSQANVVHREVRELALLFEISQLLEQSLDLHEVIRPVLKTLSEHMGMSHGTITLLNRQTGEIYIEAAHGLSASQQQKGRYQPGEGVTGKVIQTGRPAIVPRVSQEPLFLNRTGAIRLPRKKDVSFLCVPIKIDREVIGALSVNRLFSEEISLEEDIRLLSIIATMIAQAVRLRQAAQEERLRLLEDNQRLQDELAERFRPANIIGRSRSMQAVFDLITQVAKTDASVLIRGESGAGKELVAHAIHYNSPRAAKPFVSINCAALPEHLIESSLFGHTADVMPGYGERIGKIHEAEGGTLFIDEVGDFPPSLQVKLLSFLQEGVYERMGETGLRHADVRVIAATRRNLEGQLDEEQFRPDLYYGLSKFPIHIPPLRERKTDIPLLADFFVEKYSKANRKSIYRISTPAIDLLMSYHWPGNVRELENCIERAVLLSTDGVIHGHHLPPTLQAPESEELAQGGTLEAIIDNVERNYIIDALKASRGNQAKAAKALGITERVMGLRLKKHGIEPRRFRPNR